MRRQPPEPAGQKTCRRLVERETIIVIEGVHDRVGDRFAIFITKQRQADLRVWIVREAAAFTRATGIRIGSPGWREAFDTFTAANDDNAGALIAPADLIEDERHDDEPPRLDWWNAPVPGWSEGKLEIRNILTGSATVIRLSDGKVLSHTAAMEDEHEYE